MVGVMLRNGASEGLQHSRSPLCSIPVVHGVAPLLAKEGERHVDAWPGLLQPPQQAALVVLKLIQDTLRTKHCIATDTLAAVAAGTA